MKILLLGAKWAVVFRLRLKHGFLIRVLPWFQNKFFQTHQKDIVVRNCVFGNFDSDELFDAGIDFKSSIGRGGKVFNITFEDLTFRNCNGPVKMSTIYYSSSNERNETSIAEFYDITMRNLQGRGFRQAGCFIGTPEYPITGLTFENVLYRLIYLINSSANKIQRVSRVPLLSRLAGSRSRRWCFGTADFHQCWKMLCLVQLNKPSNKYLQDAIILLI